MGSKDVYFRDETTSFTCRLPSSCAISCISSRGRLRNCFHGPGGFYNKLVTVPLDSCWPSSPTNICRLQCDGAPRCIHGNTPTVGPQLSQQSPLLLLAAQSTATELGSWGRCPSCMLDMLWGSSQQLRCLLACSFGDSCGIIYSTPEQLLLWQVV
ncbi:hypothetical protein GN956_G10002 [Arapaima gigas]